VWDARRPIARSRVSFWLNSIGARAGHQPTLLVGTFLDVLSPERLNEVQKEVEDWVRTRTTKLGKKKPSAGGKGTKEVLSCVPMGLRLVSCRTRQGIGDVISALTKSTLLS